MKKILLTTIIALTINLLCAQEISDFVTFRLVGRSVEVIRNRGISEPITVYYTRDGEFHRSYTLGTTGVLIDLVYGCAEHQFTLYVQTNEEDGDREPMVIRIGPAVLDDIDIKTKNLSDDELYVVYTYICENEYFEDVPIGGNNVPKDCYCDFMDNYFMYSMIDLPSVYFEYDLLYNQPFQNKNAAYNYDLDSSLLYSHIMGFCKKKYSSTNHGGKLANPSTNVNAIPEQIHVYDMYGRMLDITTSDKLQTLNTGVYIIHSYDGEFIKRYIAP